MDIIKKYNLPTSIEVKVQKTKEGFFIAQLPDFPGAITEANSFIELIPKVTDMILTYFEVPQKDALKCDMYYLPPPKSMVKEPTPSSNKAIEFMFYHSMSNSYGHSSIR